MTTTFLTTEEVQELTDYCRPKDQRKWLIDNSWPFELSSKGAPKVLRQYMEKRLGAIASNKKTLNQPNRSALQGLINGSQTAN